MAQQNDEEKAFLEGLEKLDPEKVSVPDYRKLMQKFQDWFQSNPSYAERARIILRKVKPLLRENELKIQ
ncbi:MAG TPA: hypothetical protein VLG69_04960 [Candidatus Andersenbacteria bacterium]|nr:hypothetical protein [Candidatus Andersenbacteria bacterium]